MSITSHALEAPQPCYHCGDPIPAGPPFAVAILGAERTVCCAGCQAVATAIRDAGLNDYYRFRTELPARGEALVPQFLREARVYDDARVQASFSASRGEDLCESSLLLEGIECAACLWLNEHHLASLPGVERVELNYATHRVRILWRPSLTRLSTILAAVRRIGYTAHPYDADRAEGLLDAERRRSLRRLGLAGLLGMQVMIAAVALYAGDWYGIEARFRELLRWASLVLATPIIAFSARPFFAGAWRGLRHRAPGMDLPVAIGLGIAFTGSVHATVTGSGAVYFDSVAMFVFALLLARFLELEARRRAVAAADSLARARPAVATRLAGDGTEESVPVGELRLGDHVLVRAGETVPADAKVLDGQSTLDESVLTGESAAVPKTVGDALIGGSVNYESPLVAVVERVGSETVLGRVLDLVDRARAERPRVAALADRVAAWFVSGILVVAALAGLWWWRTDPDAWLPVTIAILVVTCPCALSLATPTAMTAALSALLGRGVVVTHGQVLERLAAIDTCVFDKTGTLTEGRLEVAGVCPLAGTARADVLAWSSALERASEHPLARAIRAAAPDAPGARSPRSVPGSGMSGMLDERTLHIGTLAHVRALSALDNETAVEAALHGESRTVAILADESRALGVLVFDDTPRASARTAVERLAGLGVDVRVLSGDRPEAVARAAAALGIRSATGGLSPAAKVDAVRVLRASGRTVAMTGDGVNDAPVLAAADVSAALGSGTDAARASADLLLLGENLADLPDALATARRTRAIIRQNLAWALGYNVLAVPAAAAGLVSPWLAVIGMSASSLLVVANGLRAGRRVPS